MKYEENIFKKRENALLETFKCISLTLFLLKSSQSNPLLDFYSKKYENYLLYIYLKAIRY
jgi:hypothetical protein